MDDNKTEALQLTRADLECLDDVAELFDQYRQFYEQPADFEKARHYISQRMANGESVIFLARLGEKPAGFVQLYGSFCSIAARPMSSICAHGPPRRMVTPPPCASGRASFR